MFIALRRIAARTIAIVAAGALIVSGALTLQATPAHAAQTTSLEEKVIAYHTNALRKSVGVAALKRNSAMDAVARAWAKQMAVSGDFKHNPNYYKQIPGGWNAAGENIAMGWQGGKQLYTLWRNSPGHYQNMVRSSFTHIGIGVYKYRGSYYGVQVFGGYSANPGGTYAISKPTVSPGSVKVSGTMKVGKRVKAVVSQWGPMGTTYSYRWLRNGKPISKATKSTYKLTRKDKGKRISVKVTGKNSSAYSKAKKSASRLVR